MRVENTTDVPGKTAVQAYLQKPYTSYDVSHGIEKATVELVGFAKTDVLEKGEPQTVTVTVKASEFKTYDADGEGTYILEKGDYYLAIGDDCHDALNNILAAKNHTKADGMTDSLGAPTDGKVSHAHRIGISADDFETYGKSEWTGYEIKNQLSDGDLNKYAGTKDDQTVKYLSHNDWDGTYPTAAVSLECTNAAEVKDLQSKGVIVCAKHFAFNDQEINRCGVATWLDEQTAREIYLKAFELGVGEGKVASLMSSFPRLGCKWVGIYSGLFTEILHNEWDFDGFVETDSAFGQYYMTHYEARAEGMANGIDFWMSGGHTDVYGLGTPADNKMMWKLYKDNAKVVSAMREACHRIIYAQLHSMAVNGMTAGSEIVYVTPWWQDAIKSAQIAAGVVMGVCAAMAIASFVLYCTLFKKSRTETENKK